MTENFIVALKELESILKKYLLEYEKNKKELDNKSNDYQVKEKLISVLLNKISPIIKGESIVTQLANDTRLQLEIFLNAQENNESLSIIEKELDQLNTNLSDWKEQKKNFNKGQIQDEWNGIYEIAQQAYQEINYLKEQEKKIRTLLSTYKKSIKESNKSETKKLKEEIEHLVDESKNALKIK